MLFHRPDPGAVPAGHGARGHLRRPGAARGSLLAGRFRALLGDTDLSKPFECVGEVNECRAALLLADQRGDRGAFPLLHELAAEVRALPGQPSADGLLQPVGEHFIPVPYAEELLA